MSKAKFTGCKLPVGAQYKMVSHINPNTKLIGEILTVEKATKKIHVFDRKGAFQKTEVATINIQKTDKGFSLYAGTNTKYFQFIAEYEKVEK